MRTPPGRHPRLESAAELFSSYAVLRLEILVVLANVRLARRGHLLKRRDFEMSHVTRSTRLLLPRDAIEVAAIDAEARAGDFLPSLGTDFLTAMYAQLLAGPFSWGHGVSAPSGELLGFVVGCVDTERVFKELSPIRNPTMLMATVRALLRRPSALIRMIESLFYTSRESVRDVHAELIVIGTRHDVRSSGIGAQLIAALAGALVERGTAKYRVTVKTKNQQALRFYARHGFELVSRFQLYGEGWNVLVADALRQSHAIGSGEPASEPGASPVGRPEHG